MRGDGTLYKRKGSDGWWMQYFIGQRRIRKSCGTTNKEFARNVLRNATQEARGGRLPCGDPLIADLIASLLQWYRVERQKPKFAKDSERQWTQHLSPVFGNWRASRVTSDSLREYREKRVSEGASHTTVNRELHVLRKAYRLAAKSDPPKVSRVPNFTLTDERNNARLVFAKVEEIERLREEAAKMGLAARTAIQAALAWGWRRGEFEALRVSDVFLSDRCVRLRTSKNGEPREAPLGELFPLVQALVAGRASDERLFAEFNFDRDWARLRKAAGCQHLRFHDFRRTSARLKRAAGVDSSVIMEMQGWKSEALFRRYAIVGRDDKLDAMQKQTAYMQEQSRAAAENRPATVAPTAVH